MTIKRTERAGRWVGVWLTLAFLWGVAPTVSVSATQVAQSELSPAQQAGPDAPTGFPWKAPLLAKCVLNSARVQYAAPAVGDLDHSGALAIVVGTSDGWVHAVKVNQSTCVPLWSYNVKSAVDAVVQNPTSISIRTAPMIADVNRDGWNEVFVSFGSVIQDNQNGGVVALTHDGKLLPGWPQPSFTKYSAYTDGILNSPAAVDLDGDGYLEVVAGSVDNRVYAWHHDGTWVWGWPRFVFDTVWSSPAVGDLDNSGLPQVVIGVDAHQDPLLPGSINGGALYVFDREGSTRAGFPKYVNEIIQSSPALADLNKDGYPEIIHGGGICVGGAPICSVGEGTDGKKVFVRDRNGNTLRGWPQSTGGNVTGAPAIADINNDGNLEVVVGSMDGKLYAWGLNGSLLPGWPMTPIAWTGAANKDQQGHSPIVANYNAGTGGNNKLKAFVNIQWEVAVIDADGKQLTYDGTGGNGTASRPTYYADYSVEGPPIVADLQGDGTLELIVAGGAPEGVGSNAAIYVWPFPTGSTAPAGVSSWPMFKHDSARSGNLGQVRPNDAAVVQHSIPSVMAPGQRMQVQVSYRNTGANAWSGAQSYHLGVSGSAFGAPGQVELPSGVSMASGGSATLAFYIVAPSTPGYYPLSVRMARGGVGAFGAQIALNIKVSNQPALYVLCDATTGGGVYPGGLAAPIAPPAGYDFWFRVSAFKLGRLNAGYYLLDNTGFEKWTSGAQDLGSAVPFRANSVELVMGPDRQGFYAIDHNGYLALTSGAIDIPALASPFRDGGVTSFAITPDYRGMYVLHRSGEIRRSGTAADLGPMTPRFHGDTALKIKLTRDGKGYYVLDSSGRVYRGGNASDITPTYALHPGEDWARDFELTDDQKGKGYYLLDKDGRIYPAGTAEPLTFNVPATCGESAAKDLELADSRTAPLAVIPSAPQISMITGSGEVPPESSLNIASSDPDEALNWTVRLDPPAAWVSVAPTSGATPATIDVSVKSVLPVGSYATTLQFRATDSSGQQVQKADVPITLRVWAHLYRTYLPTVLR